jgi:clan AA aspartic protease (TIGR02281 family)
MKVLWFGLMCVVAVCFLALEAGADTIYLKNGRNIVGTIKKEDAESLQLDIGFGVVGFRKSEIDSIYRSTFEETEEIQERWKQQRQESLRRNEEVRRSEELAPKKVELFTEGGHLVVEAVLNKKINAQLVLDTGAQIVMLSRRIAETIGVYEKFDPKSSKKAVELIMADGRKAYGKKIILKSLSVEGQELQDVEAVFLYEDLGVKALKDGLLGMSFLSKFNFQVDYKNKKLVLEKLR